MCYLIVNKLFTAAKIQKKSKTNEFGRILSTNLAFVEKEPDSLNKSVVNVLKYSNLCLFDKKIAPNRLPFQ